jgi:hypothetical protein
MSDVNEFIDEDVPVETDNEVRAEDGEQDVSQDPTVVYGEEE